MIENIPYYLKHHPTGSRFICTPPPTNTDNDTVILVEDGALNDVTEYLVDGHGWELGGSRVQTNVSCWRSFKLGEDNYIVTDNSDFYDKYVKATLVAKEKNLLRKQDRIDLFTAFIN